MMTTDGDYAITLRLTVADVGRLWDAAAARAANIGALDGFEIVDTLGPREDPGVADCLAMLFDPSAIPGCLPVSWHCVADAGKVRSNAPAAVALPAHPALARVVERPRSATPTLPPPFAVC